MLETKTQKPYIYENRSRHLPLFVADWMIRFLCVVFFLVYEYSFRRAVLV